MRERPGEGYDCGACLKYSSPEVAAQLVPNHGESDLIKGAQNRSAIGMLVGRKMGDARVKSGLRSFSHVPNQMGCRNV